MSKCQEMNVVVMSRRTGMQHSSFTGNMRVSKSFKGDQWFVIKDLTDEEMQIMNTTEDIIVNKYPVEEYFIILS